MFPALTQALRELKQGFGTQPEPLDLKDMVFSTGAEYYARNGWPNIAAAWAGGAPSWSGETVTNDTSLNHSAVWCCRRIISEAVAAMPLELMQSKGGSKQPATEHPVYRLLHDEPNNEQSDMEFRELLTDRTLAGGNSYAKINRRSGTGTAIELVQIPTECVKGIDRDQKKRLVYHVKDGNDPEQTFTVLPNKPLDILHIRGLGFDGIRGYSVLTMARQSFGTAIATEKNMGRFFGNGARLPYNLKLSSKFKNDDDATKFRNDWESIYRDPHKVPILEPWLEYQQTGISMADAQMLETRMFEIPEICRWFLLTPHMVGDLSRGTFSNIENLYLQFVKGCLSGWIRREEKAFWRCLLTPEEKSQGYYFKHNINSLLRGDFLTRMQGYAIALQNGFKNIDEVRDLEDENALADGAGEAYHIQLNQATVPGTGEPMPAEQPRGIATLGPKGILLQ